MKIYFILPLLILTIFITNAFCEDYEDIMPPKDPTGVYLELGGSSDPDIAGGEIGLSGYGNKHIEYRASFAFLAKEGSEDIFTGLSIGARAELKKFISPFLGIGVFTGYSKEDVAADKDDEDNYKDGTIDEDGEKKDEIKDIISAVYPEAGFHFYFTETSRFTVSAKYYITSEGRDNDFFVYSIGFGFFYE